MAEQMKTEAFVLPMNKMQLSDYVFARWGLIAPVGTTLDDIMHPAYFRNYAMHLKPHSVIEVVTEDMELDVQLRVIAVTKTTVDLRVINDNSPTGDVAVSDGDFSMKWGGPVDRWRVMYGGEVFEKGIMPKSAAAERVNELNQSEAA